MSAKANPPTCPCLLQGWHHYNNVHYPRPCWRAAIIHWSHVTVNSSSAICHSPGSEQALMAELYLEHWKGSIEPYWGLKPFGYGSKHVKTLAAWFSHQISWQNWIPHDPTERYGLGLDIWLSHSHQKRPRWDDEVSGPEIHWLNIIFLTKICHLRVFGFHNVP